MTDSAENSKWLVHFDTARQHLALARNLDEVKQIRDQAEALRQYIRQQGAGLEMQNYAAEIKLRAERRAGEMLAEMEKNPGGNPNQLHDATGSIPPSYKELGIEKTQAMRWQLEAEIPEEVFERFAAETKAKREELTSRGVLAIALKLEIIQLGQSSRRNTGCGPYLSAGIHNVDDNCGCALCPTKTIHTMSRVTLEC